MESLVRIEQVLADVLADAEAAGCPPRLAAAVRHAVFPGGARLRPRLVVAVARACGEAPGAVAAAAAAAIELIHCASLVHDDLPCFDDAATRRGRASVHRAFGERTAVLAGDALIVLAYQTLAQGCATAPDRLPLLVGALCRGVGMPAGIIAGQAWESEPFVALAEYQRAKTGALFAAATMAGAIAAGVDAAPWRALGERLGEAYQVADDIRDAAGDPEHLGKPVGRDAALGRPSATRELGVGGAVQRLEQLLARTFASIPPCPGADELRAAIVLEAQQLLPRHLARAAA